MPMASLRGQLLIAHAALLDPNFRRTVVLLIEHEPEAGAMGLVLNRPSEVAVADAAPPLARLAGDDAHVFVGGPVAPEGLIVLAEFDDPADAALPVAPGIGVVGGDTDLDAAAAASRRARVFAGHAGWAPGQLEAELDAEGWIVEEHPPPDEILAGEPERLWSTVLSRMGGGYALMARMPLDPSVN